MVALIHTADTDYSLGNHSEVVLLCLPRTKANVTTLNYIQKKKNIFSNETYSIKKNELFQQMQKYHRKHEEATKHDVFKRA